MNKVFKMLLVAFVFILMAVTACADRYIVQTIGASYYIWADLFGAKEITDNYRYSEIEEGAVLFMDNFAILYDDTSFSAKLVMWWPEKEPDSDDEKRAQIMAMVAAIEHPYSASLTSDEVVDIYRECYELYQQYLDIVNHNMNQLLYGNPIEFKANNSNLYYSVTSVDSDIVIMAYTDE